MSLHNGTQGCHIPQSCWCRPEWHAPHRKEGSTRVPCVFERMRVFLYRSRQDDHRRVMLWLRSRQRLLPVAHTEISQGEVQCPEVLHSRIMSPTYAASSTFLLILSDFPGSKKCATDQSQQCHSDYSGLYRRNRMQEKLRFCSHASCHVRPTNQTLTPRQATHIRPHTLSRYGWRNAAFRFPVTPSASMTKANAY
ncbi:hypothetical protein TNCV_2830471 [Trichonephila clavipes]|nr:hypothetical protein TNCV_2830471 [Trichonephila clavipes]